MAPRRMRNDEEKAPKTDTSPQRQRHCPAPLLLYGTTPYGSMASGPHRLFPSLEGKQSVMKKVEKWRRSCPRDCASSRLVQDFSWQRRCALYWRANSRRVPPYLYVTHSLFGTPRVHHRIICQSTFDESTQLFVVALNDAYSGGGTYVHESDKVADLCQGEMLNFRADSCCTEENLSRMAH